MKAQGETVGRYRIEALLGMGGMGQVYEALDTRLGRRVALKLLNQDARGSDQERFAREARAAAALQHPNAVLVYDVGEAEGEMFIAMELVRGKSLRAFVGNQGVTVGRRLQWLVEVARALAAAHQAGLIHRDVKPDNVIVREDGVIKVLDFGIAKKQRMDTSKDQELGHLSTVTAEGALIGTPSYLAPEQLCSEPVDARVDQFAWAVTGYELLSGVLPWTAKDAIALLSQILTAQPTPLRDRMLGVPKEVEDALFKAMSKRAADRYETMDDAADAIEPFAEVSSKPTSSVRGHLGVEEALAKTNPRSNSNGHGPVTREVQDPTLVSNGGRTRSRLVKWIAPVLGLALAATAVGMGLLRRSHDLTAQAEATAPLVVQTLACQEARLSGGDGSKQLARALGVGACARLAVEIGVDWVPVGFLVGGSKTAADPATALDVDVRMDPEQVEVRLAAGDRRAAAKAATPMEAMVHAVGVLSKQLTAPQMTPEEVSLWGAKDAASAREIVRTLHRMQFDFAPDDQAAAREVVAMDPTSPYAHYIAWLAGVGGPEGQRNSSQQVIAHLAKMPHARQLLLSWVKFNKYMTALNGADAQEALRMLRQAYAESPDDPTIMLSFVWGCVSAGALEEGLAVLDRLAERFPAYSVWVTLVVLRHQSHRFTPDQYTKYLKRLWEIYPESQAWNVSVQHAVVSNQLEEARQAVDLAQKLGVKSAVSGTFYIQDGYIWYNLVTLKPKVVREYALPFLGIPRDIMAEYGARMVIASYFMEGRVDEAMSAVDREFRRHEPNDEPSKALFNGWYDILCRLLLERPLPGPERLSWMDKALANQDDPIQQARLRLVQAVAALGVDPSKQAKDVANKKLIEMERLAEQNSDGNRSKRDTAMLQTLPFVRLLRGQAEAAKLWQQTDRAPEQIRRIYAIFAALAFEATGKLVDAEAVYKLALRPEYIEYNVMGSMIARIRLADIYRSQKRDAEALIFETEVNQVWEDADSGLKDQIRHLGRRF